MSAAIYRLRIERGPDAEDYPSAEDLGRLFADAEELIGEGLPEGWYCKIEETPVPTVFACSPEDVDESGGVADSLK